MTNTIFLSKIFVTFLSLYALLDRQTFSVMGEETHHQVVADLIKASNGSLNSSEISLTDTHLKIPRLNLDLKFNSTVLNEALDDPNIVDKAIKVLQKNGNHGVKRKHKSDDVSCLQAGRDIMNSVLPSVSACMKEMKLTLRHMVVSTNAKQVFPCFAKCMGVKMKVINPNGTGNVELGREWVESLVPPRFMGTIMTLWQTCEDLFMTMKVVDGDVSCEAYRRPITCVVRTSMGLMRSIIKLCPGVPDFVKEAAVGFLESSPVQTIMDSIYDKNYRL